MRRRLLDCFLLILGSGLIAAGRYTLVNFDAAAGFVNGYTGNVFHFLVCALNDIMPCGVLLGELAVCLGALMLATAAGLPAAPHAPEVVPTPVQQRPWQSALLLANVVLAALGSLLSIRTQPGTWPLVLWMVTLLLPMPVMIGMDRARGTGVGNPFSRREGALLLLVVLLDLFLVGHDMTQWWWAGTPDETDFFGVAKSIATGTSQRPLLSEGGVFTFQPVLSSLYPALFMDVLGVNVFAWKLSSVVALAAALPFTYVFVRELWDRRAAIMAMAFFGTAQMAVGFSHYGYNNVQVYPIVGAGLGVMAWAWRRRSLFGYYLAGCIAGLGFFTYYTARAVAPLLILFIWTCDGFPLARRTRVATVALMLGLGFTILPIFSDLGTVVGNMLHLAVSGEQVSTPGAAVIRVFVHWWISIVHGLWYPGPHHFQSNPIDDPISGTLAIIGLCLCLLGWRRANGRFLCLAYLLSTFLVGATSQHYRPPLTRLLFLSPLTAVLAAVGAEQLLRVMQGSRRAGHGLAWATAGALLVASAAWNMTTLDRSVRELHHGYGDGTTSELLRMVQQLPETASIIFVQRDDVPDGLVELIMDEYGMTGRFSYQRGIGEPTLTVLAAATPPFVLFVDLPNSRDFERVETEMQRRFPAGVWQASDPGQPWSLRYFDVSAGARRG